MAKNQSKSAVTGILMVLAFAISCTKIDTTSIGENLIPPIDNIHTFDTTYSVIAVNYDSTECDTIHRSNLQALGIISNDPLFGSTHANVYVEFKPENYPFRFPVADANSFQIDSAVLVLNYSHSYGDTNTMQKVMVYQLSDSFDISQSYTTCSVLGYDNSVLLGEKNYLPSVLKDSIQARDGNFANQLRIPIATSLIQSFINDSAKIFKSDSAFVSYFHGFALIADSITGGQALNYFDFTESKLQMYLRYTKGDVLDTTVVSFGLSGYSGLSNSVIRDHGTSEITNHLSHPSSGDSLIYLQTSPGTYAMLTIPAITGLSTRVINRAEIIIDQVYSDNSLNNIFTPPLNLYLEVKDPSISGNNYIPVPCDFSPTALQNNFQYLGGQLTTTKNSDGQSIAEYQLNITRYLQSLITKGKSSLPIKLSAPQYAFNKSFYVDWCGQGIGTFSFPRNTIAEGRVVLNGTNDTPMHIRLHVVYTKL